MNTITKLVVYLVLTMVLSNLQAQSKEQDSIRKEKVDYKISILEKDRAKIEDQEKEVLKLKISKINAQLDAKEITAEEAENLKKEAAKKAALNIESRRGIIDEQIELLRRNAYDDYQYGKEDSNDDSFVFRIGSGEEGTNDRFIYLGSKSQDKPVKYDRRTITNFVVAFGLNNALIEDQKLEDSPYKIGGSGFVELGFAWKTRIFENTNFWRLKYGLSIQWNKLDIKNNQYLVNTDGDISLQEFPIDTDKVKFRATNLVFPMHLEFGPSKKIEREDYFRYSTYKQLKVGLGGYAGLNMDSMQKLKYKEDGKSVKDKQHDKFEASEFIYGLSGYIALGDVALYVKYDLNPLFKNQAIDQNNISVGVRFDMD